MVMTTRGGYRLGRKTLSQFVEYLEKRHTWASLQQFLFKHGLDQRLTGSSKLSDLGAVFHPLATSQHKEEIRRAFEALEEITTELHRKITEWEDRESPSV